MNRPLRICFVAPEAYPVLSADRSISFVGGAEVQQSLIAPGLARRGHDVSMISMDFGQREGDLMQGVRLLKMHAPDAGVPVLRFLHPRLTSVWSAMQRADADVYYQRSASALTGFVAAFARSHRRRWVFSGASDFDFDPALPLIPFARDKWLFRYGLTRADEIVVQSERQIQMCRKSLGRDPVRINSCYGHRGLPSKPQGLILWVGTVKPLKRPEIFLDLAQRLPQYRFRLIGGPAAGMKHFEGLRQRALAIPNLEMTGFVPHADVESHFDGASMLVNTSIGEGFPNTFMQAWARSMPTVSFFDPGAVQEGRPVSCVASDFESMVQAVRSLKESTATHSEYGERALRFFEENHGVHHVLDDYERVIESILNRDRKSAHECRS